jgi:hypothetical protein
MSTPDVNAAFSYESLESRDGKYQAVGSFCSARLALFHELGGPGKNPYQTQKITNTSKIDKGVGRTAIVQGWKFHVSIDDSIPGNLAKGSDVVKDVLISHHVAQWKVVSLNELKKQAEKDKSKPPTFQHDVGIQNMDGSYEEEPHVGKQITIYHRVDPDNDWENIINEIETGLRSKKVIPGAKASTISDSDPKVKAGQKAPERDIQGSAYITYRYEIMLATGDTRNNLTGEVEKASTLVKPEDEEEDPFKGVLYISSDMEAIPAPKSETLSAFQPLKASERTPIPAPFLPPTTLLTSSSGASTQTLSSYENMSAHVKIGKVFSDGPSIYTKIPKLKRPSGYDVTHTGCADQAEFTGVELHITIDDSVPDNLRRGWDTIHPILVKYRVGQTFVIDEGLNTENDDPGKQVIIYPVFGASASWPSLLREIEIALECADVVRGTKNSGDAAIQGSDYIGYCCTARSQVTHETLADAFSLTEAPGETSSPS